MSLVTLPHAGKKGTSIKMVMRFKGAHYFLSNMYPCTITLPAEDNCPELDCESSEVAYQAAKTLDPEIRARMAGMSGRDAKKFAHREDFPLRPDYSDEWRIATMRALIAQKFSARTDETQGLAKRLIATDDATLVEGNHWGGGFFGLCLHTGSGENHLGKLLMARRNELPDMFAELSAQAALT